MFVRCVKVLVFSLAVVMGVAGCSGDDGGGGASKSIFASWTRTDGMISFDITGQSFDNPFAIGFLLGGGEICACTALVSGTEASGTVDVYGCSYISGGAGDPDCAGNLENGGNPYTYTKSGASLSLCDNPSSCGSYR